MVMKPGDRVGDWVVESPLGEGGMATVYRVHSALSERVVGALKVMKPSLGPEARARFVREAEALSALRHPGIVHVMGFSEDSARGLLYLVMELAVGETLKARLERGPLSVSEALATCIPLAAALEHAHAEGIFHRDIKPANIILCDDGTVRLVDFGIAAAQDTQALTQTGHVGTVSYLPPEIFRGRTPEPARLDVYSFGLVLYESLVGTRPFPVAEGLTPTAAAAAVGVQKLQQGSFDPGEAFPEELRHIVRRATDPEPSGRPTMYGISVALHKVPRPTVEDNTGTGPHRRGGGGLPAEDHTMRVPDPASPRIPRSAGNTSVGVTSTGAARRRGRDRRSRRDDPKWWLGWAAAALMVVVTLLLLFLRRGPAGPVPGAASPSASPAAVAQKPEAPPARPRAASPVRASTSPASLPTGASPRPLEASPRPTNASPRPAERTQEPGIVRPYTPATEASPSPWPSASPRLIRPLSPPTARPGSLPTSESEPRPDPSAAPPQ